ncbi:glutathione synthetase [Boudabousia tangfeifanii]|uniref:Glutathione synthetase n=1 Tax=Boudabousia tangfeifanii TaxID=1912795 RepID=A0A1D9MJC8_9ACTO|nr:glutathione synthetase [Boudabousia tangfeifanii]AOZ72392.1 glutathione synthetase [Boudabousia tangfeifanii]
MRYGKSVSKPIVYLVTSANYPSLDEDSAILVPALKERGMDPRIAVWDDPTVDWSAGSMIVIRSVDDYAQRRDEFLAWAHSQRRVLNHPDILDWNTDKHYLQELALRGLSTIPTTWLEPEQNLTKHKIHSRFPALGDFVVKPAVSSGGRDAGRYTANSASSRQEAIMHAVELLEQGRTVMVQRYLEEIDTHGEISLIYVNGLISHVVEKKPMLHSSINGPHALETPVEEVTTVREATAEEWGWGEEIRAVLHGYVKERLGHDQLFLFNRIDLVRRNGGGYYVMEVSLVDASLYLRSSEDALTNFVDAISQRAFW